jgi:putative IMPACT (imprinted ancient) family translation regulator
MHRSLDVIGDRGSRCAVSGGPVRDAADVDAFLSRLKSERRFARATHNRWAVPLSDGSPLRQDHGKAAAGATILRMLEREGLADHVVVTRRYGGTALGGDRFRHVAAAVRAWLETRPGAG